MNLHNVFTYALQSILTLASLIYKIKDVMFYAIQNAVLLKL